MQILNASEFLKDIMPALEGVGQNPVLPIIEAVCFDGTKVFSTNMETWVVRNNVPTDFKCAVSSALLRKALSLFGTGPVEITMAKNKLSLKGPGQSHTIETDPVKDFPKLPEFSVEYQVDLPQFVTAARLILPFCDTDPNTVSLAPHWASMLIRGGFAYGIPSHRLCAARYEMGITGGELDVAIPPISIPSRFNKMIKFLGDDVRIGIEKDHLGHIMVQSGNVVLICNNIENPVPYEVVFGERKDRLGNVLSEGTLVLNDLQSATAAAISMSDSTNVTIRMAQVDSSQCHLLYAGTYGNGMCGIGGLFSGEYEGIFQTTTLKTALNSLRSDVTFEAYQKALFLFDKPGMSVAIFALQKA